MTTSQNNSRLGLCILTIAMAVAFTVAVGAQGNGKPVRTMQDPTIDVMTMMMTADNMPIQNVTDAV